MDSTIFKKRVDKEIKKFLGIKVGKKYVWDYPELLIFIDIQRSEFKESAFFINVSYFIKSLSAEVERSQIEYLGDIVYRFHSGTNEVEYNDCFLLTEIKLIVDLETILNRELNKFINEVRSVEDLKTFIKKYKVSRPFIKLSVEKFLWNKEKGKPTKTGILSFLFKRTKN